MSTAPSHPMPDLPSNRRFGALFVVVFVVFALIGWWRHWPGAVQVVLAALAAATGLIALWRDAWLEPFNRAWAMLGRVLGRVISPLVLGAIYFLLITPLALTLRAFGRDELVLRRRRDAASHWIPRQPPGPNGDSFRNQY